MQMIGRGFFCRGLRRTLWGSAGERPYNSLTVLSHQQRKTMKTREGREQLQEEGICGGRAVINKESTYTWTSLG